MKKMNNMELLQKAKTPGLVGWANTFMSNDVVKNVIPKPEVFIELLKKMLAMAKAASN